MKRHFSLLLGLISLLGLQSSLGMATEQFGPSSAQPHPTSEQPGWPAGTLPIAQHESLVYSIWVNGNENFYFQAKDQEVQDLIAAFSAIRLRDHEVVIKSGEPTVKPIRKDPVAHNVQFTFMGGIAHSVYHGKMEAKTWEPTLTVYLHPDRVKESLRELVVPENILLRYELEGSKLKSPHQIPKREVWHTQVQFPDGKPATDWEAGVRTEITFWDRDDPKPIRLATVNHKGLFHAAFSAHELGALKAGTSWLTMTTGNQLTKAKPTDPRIEIAQFSKDPDLAPITITTRPGAYYGRILFEDGSPPRLQPSPWSGADIKVSFPYAGSSTPDEEGYFSVYFTPEQFDELSKKDKAGKNIYVPSYEKKGRSTAKYVFAIDGLSQIKEEAGVIKIPNPAPTPDDTPGNTEQ